MAARPDFPGIAKTDEGPPTAELVRSPTDVLRETAAKLYGQGMTTGAVARTLCKHLITDEMRTRPKEQQLSAARTKLRRWIREQDFRDMVYNMAVVKVDMDTPGILNGVAKKAKKGNVSAARFLLEVSGRHNPRGEVQAPNVIVAINGMPRPQNTQAVRAELPSAEDPEVVDMEEDEA